MALAAAASSSSSSSSVDTTGHNNSIGRCSPGDKGKRSTIISTQINTMIWLLYTNVLVVVLFSVVVLVENKGIDAFIMKPAVIPSGTSLVLSSSFSSSRCYQSTSNDDSSTSTSTSTTNNSSSVGRLEFAYKRVNNADAEADPPSKSELRSIEPDVIAESIEKIVKEQQDQAIEQAFIGSLDAWMVASNKNKGKGNNNNKSKSTSISSVLKYGLRMEDVLTMMETNCATGVTIDAYATVIHLYLGGKEPIAALCVLGRMEHQLHLIQQQQQQQKKNDEFQNIKGRLIQYNRVLQGLVQSSASSAASLSVAVQLLLSMCVQEEFVYDPTTMPYNENNVDGNTENGTVVLVVPTFLPINVTPDAKSFATVIVQMIHQSISKKEENAHDEEEDQRILQLMQHAQRLDQLQVHGFLSKKITSAIMTAKMAMTEYDWDYDNYDNLKERIDDLLLDRASVEAL